MSRFSSHYLDTRLSLFARRLIGTERLRGLIDLDLAGMLSQIHFISGQSYQLDDPAAPRIEKQLTNLALEDFRILIRPYSGSERRFFHFALRWFELANLKLLIRGKFSGIDNTDIRRQLTDLGAFGDLPTDTLLQADDPYEMLRLLENTSYAAIVRQARRVYEEFGNDLFLLDATIDRSFFIDLHRRAALLQTLDAERTGKLLGDLLDRFNLLWLLRYRFSYALSSAKSFYLLTVIGNRLHAGELMRLAKQDTIEQVVAALPAIFRNLLSNLDSISDIETVLEYHMLAIAAKALVEDDSLVCRTFSYILLREAEGRYLLALIKGRQLKFETALIRSAVGASA